MTVDLKEYYYVTERIAAEWEKEGRDAENITGKLDNILTAIGLKKEDMALFKSQDADGGYYIFACDDAPFVVEALFLMYDNIMKKVITANEKERLKEYLIKSLPLCRKARDLKILNENTDKNHIFDLVSRYMSDRDRIGERVENFYMGTRNLKFFRERIFVSVSAQQIRKVSERRDIYAYQYKLIRDWRRKWADSAEKEEEPEKRISGKNVCRRECESLIRNVLDHLKGIPKEDCNCTVEKAFEELEIIHQQVINYLNLTCHFLDDNGGKEEGTGMLYRQETDKNHSIFFRCEFREGGRGETGNLYEKSEKVSILDFI